MFIVEPGLPPSKGGVGEPGSPPSKGGVGKVGPGGKQKPNLLSSRGCIIQMTVY